MKNGNTFASVKMPVLMTNDKRKKVAVIRRNGTYALLCELDGQDKPIDYLVAHNFKDTGKVCNWDFGTSYRSLDEALEDYHEYVYDR